MQTSLSQIPSLIHYYSSKPFNLLVSSINESNNFSQFSLLTRDSALWGGCPQLACIAPMQSIQELTFNVLTTGSFHRAYSPPLTDMEDVTPPASPFPKPLQPALNPVMSQSGNIVIETSYDPFLPSNLQFHAPRDHLENNKWTENERAVAANTEPILELEDLKLKLASHYVGGVKNPHQPYLQISTSAFPR